MASFEKRAAGVTTIGSSLRPTGIAKEAFAGKTAHELDAERLEHIGSFVDKGRAEIGVPGVAIGLVQGGKVVLARGFGVKQLGKPDKIDADTLFIIASNTKALSTLLLATEVDQGKFTWDTPVTQVYPRFKLGDADTTSRVLMKHLVCACTGLPRQDLEWLFEYDHATPESELELLGTFQPTTRFGETFQYSNLLASAAGFIGGHVAYPGKELGAAYDLAMKKRIFDRLGMKATTFDYARAWAGNHAWPHAPDRRGEMAVASMAINYSIVPLRPAGGAWSTVRDLLRYVQMELAKGKLADGRALLSEDALLARRAPQVPIGAYATYGMGLVVDTQYGVAVVHHGGDMIGFHSDMFWLPEHGVGGVILTNADGGWLLPRPFIRKVLEELFDGRPEAAEDIASHAAGRRAELAKERERWVVPPDADIVAKLAPRYTNPSLGGLAVTRRGGTVTFDLGEWKSTVASRKNDDGTTSLVTIDPGVDGYEFVAGEAGGKRTLVIRDRQHEYVFAEAEAGAKKPK
jgi:CubicO group peptidase (beta-lactamase class C family)